MKAFREISVVNVGKVNNFFDKKVKKYFSKKRPESKSYPYKIIDPYRVLGEDSGYEKFYLVGDNWEQCPDKPIAICWGYNDWKLGFVSAYLSEYRVAFASRKKNGFSAVLDLNNLKVKPKCFVVWGYNDSRFIRFYIRLKRIPLYRMEDGFIRSSTLGASHSVPYSLVLDRSGSLYYDSNNETEIEGILNSYDFKSDVGLVQDADACMRLINRLRVTKYNQPEEELNADRRIKVKKTVAVLGQVDSDASIRLGNPDNWNTEALIKLAAYENPDAEILYRPHPEVYRGYQKSKFKSKKVKYISTIVSPDTSIDDFLAGVDHVYTITSLTGFEALIRGIKVTTVGAPFYAGWGVSDDRVKIKRRKRKLNLNALFAGAYLLYPRYLSCPGNAVQGLKNSAYQIVADKSIALDSVVNGNINKGELGGGELNTEYWLKAFFKLSEDFRVKNIDKFDYKGLLSSCPGEICHYLIVSMLLGKSNDDAMRDRILLNVRAFLDEQVFLKILGYLGKHYPGLYVYTHFSWVLGEAGYHGDAIQVLEKINHYDSAELDEVVDAEFSCEKNVVEYQRIIGEFFQRSVLSKDYKVAIDYAAELSILGGGDHSLLLKCVDILRLNFDFNSAYGVAKAASYIDMRAQNKKAISLCFESAAINGLSFDELIVLALKDLSLKPERLLTDLTVLKDSFPEASEIYLLEVLKTTGAVDSSVSYQKATLYLELGDFDKALNIVESMILNGDDSEKARLTYSKMLSAHGRYEEALRVVSESIQIRPSESNIREKLRLLFILGRFHESLSLVDFARSNFVATNSSVLIPAYLGVGRIKDAYDLYREIPFRDDVISYFPNKYLREIPEKLAGKLLLIAVYGPGDEIRFASIYSELVARYSNCQIKITCDVRLISLFQRSFPQVEFVPVKRIRSYGKVNPYEDYNLLPGSDLCALLDNDSVSYVESSDHIALVSDFLSSFRETYDCFQGRSYLQPNSNKKKVISDKLPTGDFLVGINWRSSLLNFSRNIHYLTIEELSPILSLDGLTFVNLQYDGCDEELAWVESNWPGKLINISEIDQYNDFDSVASLMSCLDLVIAPCTSVAELAGAIGVDTFLLGNDGGMKWRNTDEYGTDVWHGSVTLIEGDVVDDKESLVNNLHSALSAKLTATTEVIAV